MTTKHSIIYDSIICFIYVHSIALTTISQPHNGNIETHSESEGRSQL
jgi:hypothetical protein